MVSSVKYADKNILIVDDDEELLELLHKSLSAAGFTVETAKEGKGAAEKAKVFQPDLILMDILLPDTDGAEVVKILQDEKETARIPVLFLSGIVSSEDEDQEEELTVGYKTYPAIAKPFTNEELLQRIDSLL